MARPKKHRWFKFLLPSAPQGSIVLDFMLQLTHSANAADDEETTIEALNTLVDLLDSSMPLLTSQLPHLVTWCMQTVCDTGKPLVVRQSALQVCIFAKKKHFCQINKLKKIQKSLAK